MSNRWSRLYKKWWRTGEINKRRRGAQWSLSYLKKKSTVGVYLVLKKRGGAEIQVGLVRRGGRDGEGSGRGQRGLPGGSCVEGTASLQLITGTSQTWDSSLLLFANITMSLRAMCLSLFLYEPPVLFWTLLYLFQLVFPLLSMLFSCTIENRCIHTKQLSLYHCLTLNLTKKKKYDEENVTSGSSFGAISRCLKVQTVICKHKHHVKPFYHFSVLSSAMNMFWCQIYI